ncbi:nitrilase-related carbon-nitrogen hydrolase, partial [Marinobacter mobilis]|uniref:nitrilase-related carbon-nitrogen hydrolase n=1 Tax=Marinobacter mobilis TaxID=488533 RepID=UPI0035C77A3C
MSHTSGQVSPDSPATKLRVVMAQVDCLVGDIPGNTQLVIESARTAHQQHQADVVVFPELCLTGYPPEDLLLRPSLDVRIDEALETLKQAQLPVAIVFGAPARDKGLLYNAALVLESGEIT